MTNTQTYPQAPAPKKKSRRWLWILIAVVAIFVLIGAFSGSGETKEAVTDTKATSAPVVQPAAPEPSPTPEPVDEAPRTVIYEVTSDSAVVGNVTYSTSVDGNSGTEQATDAPAPFTKEIPIGDEKFLDFNYYSLTAQAAQDATSVSCKITVAGEVIAEQTSTGPFAVVMCSGS